MGRLVDIAGKISMERKSDVVPNVVVTITKERVTVYTDCTPTLGPMGQNLTIVVSGWDKIKLEKI